MRRSLVLSVLVATLAWTAMGQVPKLKPGWNLFSEQQDIQLGKEASQQVEQQFQVIKNSDLDNFVNNIGRKLAATPQAAGEKWPFSFKVVNDPSINAFALPGGPMFIHTGIFPSLDNESQLAGVMAHEMSHVVLRHGTSQASKQNMLQLPLVLAGAMAGSRGGMLGSLSQLGISLAGNSVLLRFSRDAEKQADLLGAQMMNAAGYNPIEMARFFEKLEKEGGSRMPQILSDHPNPGSRVKYVSEEVQYLPKVNYNGESGQLAKVKQVAAAVPPPPKKPAAQQAGTGSASGMSAARPSSTLKDYSAKTFQIGYPDNWQTFGDNQSGTVTIAPKEALFQDKSGNTAIGYGVIVSHYNSSSGDVNLERDTKDLVNQLIQSNQGMRLGNDGTKPINVNGQRGLQTVLLGTSPYQGQTEADVLVTVARPDGLYYMVFIAPEQEFSQVQPVFKNMIQSVRFR